MRVVVVGLGVQGRKRLSVADRDVVATVDSVNSDAHCTSIDQVALESFDVAVVCTPDAVKLEILEYLLRNGKHVLVEKPLLSTKQEELEHLSALANSQGLACYTAYNHRFEPHINRLKGELEAGTIGEVYVARLFYGNGTARNVRESVWRDRGLGVMGDLGSHLLDLALYFFGEEGGPLDLWGANRFENRSPDHVIFGRQGKPALAFEMTLLSWRNTFKVDILGERGSMHVDGLCKWGPSHFTLRTRVLPSGKPNEEKHTIERTDPTWKLEYDHFVNLCEKGGSNLANDMWINYHINRLSGQVGTIA